MSGEQDNLRHEPIGLKSGNLPEVHLGCAEAHHNSRHSLGECPVRRCQANVLSASMCDWNYFRKSMLRKITPGGVPSNSMARNLRAARSSIRSRSLMNCASRWSGLLRSGLSRSSMAEVLIAQDISFIPSIIENRTTIRSYS